VTPADVNDCVAAVTILLCCLLLAEILADMASPDDG
jgi:hypothetical protein